ncbi:MAG: SDR family NAD(P)-dependent oxidoreductase, partial [Xanthobacteraceae bacterium]
GEQHETKDIREIEARQIERTFRTNIFSYFFMAKHALRHMKEGASIINTTSGTAYKGHKTLLDYSATRGRSSPSRGRWPRRWPRKASG